MYIFTLGWALLQLNTSSTVIIIINNNNKTTFGANAWCEPLRPRGSHASGLPRHRAMAESNPVCRPRIYRATLVLVIIISVSTRPRRKAQGARRRRRHEYLIFIYSFFFGGMNIDILFFFRLRRNVILYSIRSLHPYEYVNTYSTRRAKGLCLCVGSSGRQRTCGTQIHAFRQRPHMGTGYHQ